MFFGHFDEKFTKNLPVCLKKRGESVLLSVYGGYLGYIRLVKIAVGVPFCYKALVGKALGVYWRFVKLFAYQYHVSLFVSDSSVNVKGSPRRQPFRP